MAQLEFDIPRGEQSDILRRAQLPSVELPEGEGRATVKASTLKLILSMIDEHGHGKPNQAYPSLDTLAKTAQVSRTTVRRAIRALESIGLLIVTRRGRRCHYTIVWTQLSLLCGDARRMEPTMPIDGRSSDANVSIDGHIPQPNVSIGGHSIVSIGGHSLCPYMDTEDLREDQTRRPPPPPQTPQGLSDGRSWEAAEAEVARELADFAAPLRDAMSHGVDPAHVLQLVEYYRAHRDAYGPGALHARLRKARTYLPPEEGWPAPKQTAKTSTAENDERGRERDFHLFVLERRKRKIPDEQITAEARRIFGAAFCKERGR